MTQEEITTILKTIIDPELGYNIVDLGLIYNIKTTSLPNDQTISITMTLTSPGCPLAPYFIDQIKTSLATAASLPEDAVIVDITFDPPWSQEVMSEEIKFKLGL
jgi:metal-sulfur cluster biosynthetic enzyme